MPTTSFTMSIGGIRMKMTFHYQHNLYVPPMYTPFITDDPPDIQVNVWEDDAPQYAVDKEIFNSKGLHTYRSGAATVMVFHDSDKKDEYPGTVLLNSQEKSMHVYTRMEKQGEFHPLQRSFAKILVITMLQWEAGVMMHACGVNDNGKGLIFAGVSGAGKTTMATIWKAKNAIVINEDTLIIRRKDSKYWIYGTPWVKDNDLLHIEPCLLKKAFFIDHGSKNEIIQKKGSEAVKGIFPHCMFPLWNKSGMEWSMEFLSQLVRSVPCYALKFVPTEAVVDMVRALK